MSASVHSAASSRPQSTLSGPRPVSQQQNDQASVASHSVHGRTIVVEDPTVLEQQQQQQQQFHGASYQAQTITETFVQPVTSTTTIVTQSHQQQQQQQLHHETTSSEVVGQAAAGVTTNEVTYQHKGVTGGAIHLTAGSELPPGNFHHAETRKVSDVIISKVALKEIPGERVTTIEGDSSKLPTEERVITRYVKEVRHKTKVVPKEVINYETEYVDVPYDVPGPTQYVDKVVEKVDLYDEFIHVERKKPVYTDRTSYVAVNHETPVLVSQVVKPVIKESNKQVYVDVVNYEPEVIPVDVKVAKTVNSALELARISEVQHKLVNITSAQYNTILRKLNPDFEQHSGLSLPYVRENGQTLFLNHDQVNYITAPVDIQIQGYKRPQTTLVEHLAPPSANIEIASRGGSAYYSNTNAAMCRPAGIVGAMERCWKPAPGGGSTIQYGAEPVNTASSVILNAEARSVISQAEVAATHSHFSQEQKDQTLSDAAAAQAVHTSLVMSAEPGVTTTEEIKIMSRDLATTEAALSQTMDAVQTRTRDLNPVQLNAGSEIRTYPGGASLAREGGSIRSQLPMQASRVCC